MSEPDSHCGSYASVTTQADNAIANKAVKACCCLTFNAVIGDSSYVRMCVFVCVITYLCAVCQPTDLSFVAHTNIHMRVQYTCICAVIECAFVEITRDKADN